MNKKVLVLLLLLAGMVGSSGCRCLCVPIQPTEPEQRQQDQKALWLNLLPELATNWLARE